MFFTIPGVPVHNAIVYVLRTVVTYNTADLVARKHQLFGYKPKR